MKTKCYSEVCGGIGNQLFQIATGWSYSIEKGKDFRIYDRQWNGSQGNPPTSYKNNIFQNFKIEDIDGETVVINELQWMTFNTIPNIENNVVLRGYFQCPKYFDSYFDEFKKQLVLPDVDISHISPKSITFHIRFGDYTAYPSIFGDITPYFKRMFEKYKGEDIHVYTDSPEIVLKKYNEYDFKLIQTSSDLNDLTMLTKYDRIVCSNSSFSWWGAMLGNAKEILVPDKWILTIPDADIYTDRMTKYEF